MIFKTICRRKCTALSTLIPKCGQTSYLIKRRESTSATTGSIYTQGQYVQNSKIREYFYYIDHQGQLFLDDMKIKNFTSCYKEQKFLEFFFRNLRANETDRHGLEFPFVSYCGRERNYLKCDDLPYVITHLTASTNMMRVNLIQSPEWVFHFDPANLYHNPNTGRLYYELKETSKQVQRMPCKIALVKSEISIDLMAKLHKTDDNDSYKLEFNGQLYNLNSSVHSPIYSMLQKFSSHKGE